MRKAIMLGLVLAACSTIAAPRFRGFNLTDLAKYKGEPASFRAEDFELMQEWGFNFARLPMDYRFWIKDGKWNEIDADKLKPLDDVLKLGQKHKIHIQMCLHRIPGYTVAQPPESRNLFADDDALTVACLHWRALARRYKDVSPEDLSFNLFNEPDDKITPEQYRRVAVELVKAIREESPYRPICADGLSWGRYPVKQLFDLKISQGARGYYPFSISHYLASWVGSPSEKPVWPPEGKNALEDLREHMIKPWQPAVENDVSVMVGEFGAFNKTPHDVVLRWMEDNLKVWKEANWGWALWTLRGGFGILDSERTDVRYEDFRGHKLDRQMLELLRRY